jgi:DNA-binding transcriptional LysR family regulator
MIAELKTLVAVARHGTFAAAGERIGLTQAAVSGQMKRLEEKLGQRLFDRTGRSATLNETGRRVLARAGELLALADSLAEPMDLSRQHGCLRIGAIVSTQPTLVRRALTGFHRACPGYRVQVIPGLSLDLLDRLDAGELDLAVIIRPGFGLPQDVGWEPLVREPFVLAVPRDWPDTDWRTSAATRPFLRYSRHSFGGRQVERFLDQQGVSVSDWAELDDIPALLTMVANGLGVAIVPQSEAYMGYFGKVRTVSLDAPDFAREIGVAGPMARDEVVALMIGECRKAL